MKKIPALIIIILVFNGILKAQLAEDSWLLGFGFSYPRLVATDLTASDENYGGYLAIQRNFTEHTGLRFQGFYHSVQATYGSPKQFLNSKIIAMNFDMVYYLVPWESVSPYIVFGAGGIFYTPENAPDKKYDKTNHTYQLNLGIGTEWNISDGWKITTELGYHSPATEKLDGSFGTKGISVFGSSSDTYMSFNFGFQYYFSKGEPSKYNELFSGIRSIPESIDYDRIEEIVKNHIPKEIVRERIIESKSGSADTSYSESLKNSKELSWVLLGVNFDFNSSKLKIESYPILYHTAQTLLQNSGISVEIQGYTDNIGPKESNMKLAVDRANMVKDYLVNHGVASERLIPVGYAEDNPVADNQTSDGRKLNRRIEFKIIKVGE